MKIKIFCVISSCLWLIGCSKLWQTNEEYLDYLSSIVIQYQLKHGVVPDNEDKALQESGITLFNRGDINGNSLAYFQLPPNSFMFRSYGRNLKNDKGLSDDLDVYYVNKKKVNRMEFVSEINKNSDYREIYDNLFDK
jgi:hypothetical protein